MNYWINLWFSSFRITKIDPFSFLANLSYIKCKCLVTAVRSTFNALASSEVDCAGFLSNNVCKSAFSIFFGCLERSLLLTLKSPFLNHLNQYLNILIDSNITIIFYQNSMTFSRFLLIKKQRISKMIFMKLHF